MTPTQNTRQPRPGVRTAGERVRDQLRLQLQDMTMQRDTILARLLTAESDERARIAADVHDDSLQALGALRVWLQLLRGHLPSASPKVESLLVSLEDQVNTAADRLRSLLFSLEPTDGDETLASAIRVLAAHVFDASTTHWSVDAVDGGEELDRAENSQVLRIIKEALLNANAHARASEVTITIRGDAAGQEIAVVDDGIGMDPAGFHSSIGHRGLATMRDRATLVGGWCTLEASVPEGCTVRVYVPRIHRLPGTAEGDPSPAPPGAEVAGEVVTAVGPHH